MTSQIKKPSRIRTRHTVISLNSFAFLYQAIRLFCEVQGTNLKVECLISVDSSSTPMVLNLKLLPLKVMAIRPIQDWNSYDIRLWLGKVNCGSLREIFEQNRLTGRDLLELTDTQLKDDLQVRQMHLRAMLLRELRVLRVSTKLVVKVKHAELNETASIRVPDLLYYTFSDLKTDAAAYWQLDPVRCRLIDQLGVVWGQGPIMCVFDVKLRQFEQISLSLIHSGLCQMELDDTLDFDESNPIHTCSLEVMSEEHTGSKRLIEAFSANFSPFLNLQSSQETVTVFPNKCLANIVRHSSVKSGTMMKAQVVKSKSQVETTSASTPDLQVEF